MTAGQRIKIHCPFLFLLVSYVVFNLITLTNYPIVSDDEGYLANLAIILHRQGLPIIDLNLSYHGFFHNLAVVPLCGILFSGSLALIGHFFGFGLYALRLQPLFFGCLSIILVYAISVLVFQKHEKALWASFFLAWSTKYLVVARTIRQESMLITWMLAMFLCLLLGLRHQRKSLIFITAFLSGSAISIHPNGVLLPLIFFALFIFLRHRWQGSLRGLILGSIGFTLLGGLLFVIFDYLPSKNVYWDFFNSSFYDGLSTNRYKALISSPLGVIRDLLIVIWRDAWDSRYHRDMFYFVLNIFAILGGLKMQVKNHKALLLTIGLFTCALIPLHLNACYLSYSYPFLAILLASVVVELRNWFKKESIYRMTAVASCFVYLLHPFATIWFHRHYNHVSVCESLYRQIGPAKNVLASSRYIFGIPSEQVYSRFLLFNFDMSEVLHELNIDYVIMDHYASTYIDSGSANTFTAKNGDYLHRECREVLSIPEKRPRLFESEVVEEGLISLYKCGG